MMAEGSQSEAASPGWRQRPTCPGDSSSPASDSTLGHILFGSSLGGRGQGHSILSGLGKPPCWGQGPEQWWLPSHEGPR